MATKRTVNWVGGRFTQSPEQRRTTSRLSNTAVPAGRFVDRKRSSEDMSSFTAGRFCRRTASSEDMSNAKPRQRRMSNAMMSLASDKVPSRFSGASVPFRSGVYIVHESVAEGHALQLKKAVLLHTQTKQCDVGVAISSDARVPRFDECLERVSNSTCVILLQTKSILMHPWPLLAAYRAAISGTPIVCVMVLGDGYDHGSCEHHLKHLHERLDAGTLELVSSVLSEWQPPRTFDALQTTLFNSVPKLISVIYDPSGTQNETAATVGDILDKQSTMQRQVRRRVESLEDATMLLRRCSHQPGQSPDSSFKQLLEQTSPDSSFKTRLEQTSPESSFRKRQEPISASGGASGGAPLPPVVV